MSLATRSGARHIEAGTLPGFPSLPMSPEAPSLSRGRRGKLLASSCPPKLAFCTPDDSAEPASLLARLPTVPGLPAEADPSRRLGEGGSFQNSTRNTSGSRNRYNPSDISDLIFPTRNKTGGSPTQFQPELWKQKRKSEQKSFSLALIPRPSSLAPHRSPLIPHSLPLTTHPRLAPDNPLSLGRGENTYGRDALYDASAWNGSTEI